MQDINTSNAINSRDSETSNTSVVASDNTAQTEVQHSICARPGSPESSQTQVKMKRCAVDPPNLLFVDDGINAPSDHERNGVHTATVERLATHKTYTKSEREILRLIGQYLRDAGLQETVLSLIQESGCELEHWAAAKFRQHVLSGCWNEVEQDLTILAQFLPNDDMRNEMKFFIMEQKYLELLEAGDVVLALRVLREELSPLKYNTERLHRLSSFLMYQNAQELKADAGWAGTGSDSRRQLMEKLQAYLPPSVMLPPHRLEVLLKQSIRHQHDKCPYHNNAIGVSLSQESLLTDHTCGRELFPCQTYQVLSSHCDEVWYCQFSHDGRYLATGSKESSVIIWEVDQTTRKLHQKYSLDGHAYGVAFLAWSPNDRFLAVVGPEDGPDLWIWNMQTGDLRHRMTHSPDDSLTCVSWYPDSQKFVCGGTKGQFYTCDLDGNIISTWEGVRIRSVWVKSDGRTVFAADTHNRVRSYVLDEVSDKTLVKEEHPVMNFVLDKSERYALVGIAQQGLHLWDMEHSSLVRRYRGLTQGYYTIYSCFGGFNEEFIASGSEDNNVVVWHRSQEQPIATLSGHTAVVNCVAWNPKDPAMLVSCSDDATIRVWGPGRATQMSGERDVCEVTSTTSSQSSCNVGDC